MGNFLYIILPNGKRKRYKKPDMTRVDKTTANCIYDAIENHKRPNKAIEAVEKEIADEDKRLRALAERGIKF